MPLTTLEVLQSWSSSHTAQSPLISALLRQIGPTVTRPATAAALLESVMQAYFCDSDDEDGEGAEVQAGDVWAGVTENAVLPPDANRVREILDVSVKEGHCLLLYAYLRQRLPKCLNVQDENVMIASVVDWMRHLKMK